MVNTEVTTRDIERAYKLLKTYYYYDNNISLNTRIAIAQYECKNILGKQNWAMKFKEKYLDSKEKEKNIKEEIEKISVINIIKSTEPEKNNEEFTILTNKPSVKFKVKYNYLIDAPIEIHILSMLWIIKEGYVLDLELSDDVYGSRLEIKKKYNCTNKYHIDKYKRNIFKLYHKQYSQWRDKALERVSNIMDNENSNALLINMDIRRYYYRIDLETLYKEVLQVNKQLDTFLFSCIKKINKFFNEKIIDLINDEENKEKIGKEEIEIVSKGKGLPIGLLSSQLLANFYLKKFDDEVLKLLPDYYGRYVDDFIIIFKDRENYKDKDIELKKYIYGKLDRIILFDENNILRIKEDNNLILQKNKLKFYFFDKDSSNSLLKAFKEGIRENTSIFNFYTEEEEIDFIPEDSLININYSGSKNKLSSIESFKNDKFKFSVKLSQLIMLYKEGNSNIKEKEKVANIIIKHFKNNIALENFLLWEKIFIFLLMNDLINETIDFYHALKENIEKIITGRKKQKDIINILKSSLLLAVCFNYNMIMEKTKKLEINNLEQTVKAVLRSNMYRHNYASYNILTYIKDSEEKIFGKNLFKLDLLNIIDKKELDEEKIKYSPRFIHFDEIAIFFSLKNLNSLNKNILEKIKYFLNLQITRNINQEIRKDFPVEMFISKNEKINLFKLDSKQNKEKFNLGIVSIDFIEKDIEEKVLYNKEVNVEHIVKINKVLNEAIKNEVDILIFPEVCFPEKLLTKLVRFSRRTGIAVIGGLQYIKNENNVYNTLVSILPFEINNYKSCFLKLRLKNYYSPGEEQLIKGYKYEIPINDIKSYDLFSWKGLFFTVFNCFELTSLSDRALFKNYIDLMIASVYNRDIKYFRNIIDSTSRDLHCYVVQVNVQKYGDSGVVVPKKSEIMVLSNIKGGVNCNLLVTPIEIKSLREFQCKTIEYQSHDVRYKYTPPDIEEKLVKARIKNKLDKEFEKIC